MPGRVRIPLDCIVLAAGFSSRMQTFKPILPLANSTVIELAVGNALAACRRVILVTGHRAEDVESLFRTDRRVELVRNQAYETGMFSSIRRGAAEAEGPACFLQPGDLPFVPAELFFSLYDALLSRCGGEGNARPVAFGPEGEGRRGHPLLLNRAFIDLVLEAPDGSSMRELFRTTGFPRPVPCLDAGAYFDLDTPEDYEKAAEKASSGD